MAYEQRDNSGSLFKNDKKEAPNHADYKGSAMIDGIDYWVNSWMKTSKNGNTKFMSLSFTPKNPNASTQTQSRQQNNSYNSPSSESLIDDDAPF